MSLRRRRRRQRARRRRLRCHRTRRRRPIASMGIVWWVIGPMAKRVEDRPHSHGAAEQEAGDEHRPLDRRAHDAHRVAAPGDAGAEAVTRTRAEAGADVEAGGKAVADDAGDEQRDAGPQRMRRWTTARMTSITRPTPTALVIVPIPGRWRSGTQPHTRTSTLAMIAHVPIPSPNVRDMPLVKHVPGVEPQIREHQHRRRRAVQRRAPSASWAKRRTRRSGGMGASRRRHED